MLEPGEFADGAAETCAVVAGGAAESGVLSGAEWGVYGIICRGGRGAEGEAGESDGCLVCVALREDGLVQRGYSDCDVAGEPRRDRAGDEILRLG